MFSSSSSSSWKLNEDDAADCLLALGTALNAVKGGEAEDAGSGSLCVGGGRRLTTCRRDP